MPGLVNKLGYASISKGTSISVSLTTSQSSVSNQIIVMVTAGTAVSSISDSKGNSYTLDYMSSTVSNTNICIARVQNITVALQSGNTVTATLVSRSNSVGAIEVSELSGIIGDPTIVANKSGSGTSVSMSATQGTAAVNMLAISGLGLNASLTATQGSGWSRIGGSSQIVSGAWKITGSAGELENITWSLNASTSYYGAILVYPTPQPPVANFTSHVTAPGLPMTVAFTDMSTNTPTSWSWNFGDGNTSTLQSPSHTYTAVGSYTVSLTATNSAGNNTKTVSNCVVVTPPQTPVASFSTSPTSGFAPLATNFTDTSTNIPNSWSWDFGDGNTSTLQNPTNTYANPGTYTVSLTASNSAGSNTTIQTNSITVIQSNLSAPSGLYVAVATGGSIGMYSTDSSTWYQSDTLNFDLNAITYGNGLFVAVGPSCAMTSSDGINWIPRTVPTGSWSSITYGNNLFVVIQSSVVSGGNLTSSDGIGWTLQTFNYIYLQSIAYGSNLFVICSANSPTVYTSTAGMNWTSRGTDTPDIPYFNAITYDNGLFVMVSDGWAATSPDGISWTERTVPSGNWLSVTYGNGLFVAVDGNGSTTMSSPEGATWTAHALSFSSSWKSICYGQSQSGGFHGKVKANTSSGWQSKYVKVWNGSTWLVKPAKFWDGTEWRSMN